MLDVRRQRGFTLIEMMIVVAVIAILAAVVVPTFFREGRKTKASSEVTAMMTELMNKLEQYKSDSGDYDNGGNLTNGAPVTCPTATSSAGVDAQSTCITSGSAWETLRIDPTQKLLRCTYTINVGTKSDSYTTPTGFTFTKPTTTSWYTVLAECDGDGDSAKNAQYFATSVDPTIQKYNEGF